MSRKAYDAENWRGIPADARLVLGYLDGRNSAWPAEAWQHFEAAGIQTVKITVTGNPNAGICDVETGDVTPASAKHYVRARLALGHVATLYCNKSTLPAVRAACAGLDYDVIIADPTQEPHLIEGAVGVQYFWGTEYDITLIGDDDWHKRAAA